MVHSKGLRKKVVEAHWRDGWSAKRIARCRFAPGLTSVKDILRRFRDRGDYKTHYGGSRRRPALMATAHVAFLIDYLDSIDSTLFLDEMSELLKRQFNVVYKQRRICAALLRRRRSAS